MFARHRFFAYLIVVALPLTAGAQSPTPSEVFALSWAATTPLNLAHIYPFTWFDPTVSPSNLAQTASKMVAGRKVLFLNYGQRSVLGNPNDVCVNGDVITAYQCPYLSGGTAETESVFQKYFAAYSAAGGQVDFLVLDSEIWLSNWVIGTAAAPYNAIQNDSRWTTETYPALMSMGSTAGVSDATFDPLNLIGPDFWLRDEVGIWNELMYEWVGNALSTAVYAPLSAEYPNAQMSDYDFFAHHSSYPTYDLNGWPLAEFGVGKVVGTHGAPVLYGQMGDIEMAQYSPSAQAFPETPFNGFLLDVNTMRATFLGTSRQLGVSTLNTKVSPWVPYRGFTGVPLGATGSAYNNTNFYQEMLLHSFLSGASYFLLWNPAESDKTPSDDGIVSEVLTELNSMVGYSDRKTLVDGLASWTAGYIVSTMYADGQKVSRLTTSSGIPCPCSVNSTGLLTCQISGTVSIYFPGGTVHSYPNDPAPMGVWIVQPGTAWNPYVSSNNQVSVDLTSAFNVYGIFNDSTSVTNGGLDNHGTAASEIQLGNSVAWSGINFALGLPAVQSAVSNATVSLPAGQFSTMNILGSAVNGNHPGQTFVVTYTDGSTATFTQSLSDWHTPQSYPGESEAKNMAYKLIASGTKQTGPYNFYGYTFLLNSAKTVKSLALPNDRDVVVLGITLVTAQ